MTIIRIACIVAALAVAVSGLEDLRFRIRCPEPVDLQRSDSPASWTEAPTWGFIDGTIADVSPLVLSVETGDSSSACVPLLAAGGSGPAAAMLLTSRVEGARALRALGKARIEGIARPATKHEARWLEAYARSVEIGLPDRICVLEVGRRPAGPGAASALAVGGVLAALFSGWRLVGARRRRTDLEEGSTADDYPLQDRVSDPLPETTREEVRSMVEEAWESTAPRAIAS